MPGSAFPLALAVGGRQAAADQPCGDQAEHEKQSGGHERAVKDVLRVDHAVDAARSLSPRWCARRASHRRAGSAPARAGSPRRACSPTATSAARVGSGTPCAQAVARPPAKAPSTLAPTEPFIGPSSAPSRVPATAARRGPRGRIARRGAVERVGDRQAVEQQAHQHVERQRLQQIVLEQVDQAAGQGGEQRKRHDADEDADDRAPALATPISTKAAGRPVSTMPSPTKQEQHEAELRHRRSGPRTRDVDDRLAAGSGRRAARARA